MRSPSPLGLISIYVFGKWETISSDHEHRFPSSIQWSKSIAIIFPSTRIPIPSYISNPFTTELKSVKVFALLTDALLLVCGLYGTFVNLPSRVSYFQLQNIAFSFKYFGISFEFTILNSSLLLKVCFLLSTRQKKMAFFYPQNEKSKYW